MWRNLTHQIDAKPINVATILRDNNWLIRDNKDFDSVQALEGLASKSLTLAKRYEATKKGKSPQLKDIAIAEICKVSRGDDGSALLEIKMHVKQRDKERHGDDIAVKMKIRSSAFLDSPGERTELLEGFTQVMHERTLVCLAFCIAEKVDELVRNTIQGEKGGVTSTSAQDIVHYAQVLSSLTPPPITKL
jgi:hypothetical protein